MRTNLVCFFVMMILGVSSTCFGLSPQEEAENAADEALAGVETSQQAAAEALMQEEAFADEENVPAPAATVSADEKPFEEPVASVKEVPSVQEVQEPSRPRLRASSGKDRLPSKGSAGPAKTSSKFDTAAMKKRWDAIVSKEIVPGSKAYTVKSGDSLYVIARRHHTTVDLIKKANDLKSDDIYPGMKLKVQTAPFSIMVDKSRNILVLYSDGVPVKQYSVATGKNNKTPVGEFKITDKLVNPTWFKTGAIFPPGSPENALGTRWMGFDKPAYGIHGTIEPKTIGTQASEGCIRMLNADVEELYSVIPSGAKVTVQD